MRPSQSSGTPRRDSAADDDAHTRVGRAGNDVFVLALKRRVRDLERVEHAHIDLLVERGQHGRDAEEANLAFGLQREQLAERTVGVELVAVQAAVELDQVKVVGLQPAEARFHAGADVLGGVHVVGALGCAGHTAALRREDVLVAYGGRWCRR